MSVQFDEAAIRAAFAQPDNDGAFAGAFGAYLEELGKRQPAVIFAFPPKAAGTFLRTAAVAAIDGQLIRIVHAQGGRDGQPYLPLFIAYTLVEREAGRSSPICTCRRCLQTGASSKRSISDRSS